MARYRPLMIEKETGWYLVNPESFFEAIRLGWMLWRRPDRVSVLSGIKREHVLDLLGPEAAAELEDKACSSAGDA